MGRPGLPRDLAMVEASRLNCSVTITTEGTPFSSRETASWTLHVVQDPQCPMPTMAASDLSMRMFSVSLGVGLETSGLIVRMTSRTS